MNRRDFESLRDLPGKTISGPIKLSQKHATHPLLTADRVPIHNSQGISVWVSINFNPETGAKGINVTLAGEGPICRLDVDGSHHEGAGRSHKHSVQDERSVRRSLRDGVVPRPELSNKPLRLIFADFCATANIVHTGSFEAPDEEGNDA
jgi:hypothetical protein